MRQRNARHGRTRPTLSAADVGKGPVDQFESSAAVLAPAVALVEPFGAGVADEHPAMHRAITAADEALAGRADEGPPHASPYQSGGGSRA